MWPLQKSAMSADLLELMLELTSNKLPGIKNHGLVCQCSPHFHNSGFFQWHIWALNWSVDAYYVSQPKFDISLFSKFEYQSFTSSSRLTWMPGLLGVTGVVMSTFYLGFAYFSTRKFGENTNTLCSFVAGLSDVDSCSVKCQCTSFTQRSLN